jgi:hypothetical protein
VAAQSMLRSPAATTIHAAPSGCLAPIEADMTGTGRCRPKRQPRGLVADAPCHATHPTRLTPTRLGNAKGPFHERRANVTAFRTRSAFHRRIPLLRNSCWRLSRGLMGRHWCLGFAASAQLPTCVHAQALRARPDP